MNQPGDRAPAPAPLLAAQELANTVDLEMDRDRLRTVDGLAEYARAQGLELPPFDESDLAACVEFREALRDVCQAHAGVDVPPDSSATLERLLARAPLILTLDPHGAARLRPAPALTGADAVIAHVAAGIAAAAADGTWPRLKACAADSCRWVYYDRSPAGRSRWCTMAICGSRAKMRAYRSRGGR